MRSIDRKETAPYHAFEMLGKHFVYDIENSSLYSVSPLVYGKIAGDARPDAVGSRAAFYDRWAAGVEWHRLRRRIERSSVRGRKRGLESSKDNGNLSGLWLGVSHSCDLACEYCFAREPAYIGRNTLMSDETARAGIDFLIDNSPDDETLGVILFGGEPLMNLPAIEAVIAYCRKKERETSKKIELSLITNGLKLTREVYDALKNDICHIQISMDGLPEIHDRYRKTKAGGSSWEIIKENLRGIPGFERQMNVRATIVDDDTDLVACLKSLQGVGFTRIWLPRVFGNSTLGGSRVPSNFGVWRRRYLELVEYISQNYPTIEEIPESGIQYVVKLFENRDKRLYPCSNGKKYLYVDPDGDIYPCFRLITKDNRQRLGSLANAVPGSEARRVFYDASVLNNPVCSSCWARYLCGGPCFGNSFDSYGDYITPNPEECRRRKFTYYCGAYLLDYYREKNAKGGNDG